jgi:GNAT superfamily N-acetyltransferase
MDITQIDRHWMWLFGIGIDDYFHSPLTVMAHSSPFFEDYHGAWIFERQGRWIATVPGSIRDQTFAKLQAISPDIRHTDTGMRWLFSDVMPIQRIIGPAFQGAALADDFIPDTRSAARPLGLSDRDSIELLLTESDPEEADDSGIRPDSEQLFGCHVGDKLVSVGKKTDLSRYASTPGILTHPSFRGQGFGKAAVTAVMAAIFAEGKSVVYQTLETNTPSVALALSLGCRHDARHLAVRFG